MLTLMRVLVPDKIAVESVRRCDGVAPLAAIARALPQKCGAPRAAEADIAVLLWDLADKEAVAA